MLTAAVKMRAMAGRPSHPIAHAPNRIREVRTRADIDLSQSAIGKAIGVTGEQIRKWEVGENDIPLERLQQIARVLGVKAHTLLRDFDPPQGEEERSAIEILRQLQPADRERGLKILRALLPPDTRERRAAS